MLSPPVWKRIQEGARKDHGFALEVAAFGFGRPGQAVDTNTLPPTVNILVVNALQRMTAEQLEAFADRGELPAGV